MKIFIVIIILLSVLVLIECGLIICLKKICSSQNTTIRILKDIIDEMR